MIIIIAIVNFKILLAIYTRLQGWQSLRPQTMYSIIQSSMDNGVDTAVTDNTECTTSLAYRINKRHSKPLTLTTGIGIEILTWVNSDITHRCQLC